LLLTNGIALGWAKGNIAAGLQFVLPGKEPDWSDADASGIIRQSQQKGLTMKLAKMPIAARRNGLLGVPAELENGSHMRQPEFHRLYEQCPDDVKIELVGGIVYMASPLRLPHSGYDDELGFAFGLYRRHTRGVEVLHGATAILGEESEPQPDLGLRILPEYGGQSRTNAKLYVVGPPELLAEIAHSTRALDMHQKRLDYRAAGVAEYIVLCVEEQELHWFDFRARRTIRPNGDGIYRSRVFPGLWIDGAALLARDSERVEKVLREGLASKEHKTFVLRLKEAK
jgi:Uma2 family endonuclease